MDSRDKDSMITDAICLISWALIMWVVLSILFGCAAMTEDYWVARCDNDPSGRCGYTQEQWDRAKADPRSYAQIVDEIENEITSESVLVCIDGECEVVQVIY